MDDAPRELQRAVHGVHEVLPQRGEQQRAVVLHPEVSALAHELLDAALTFVQLVRRLKVLGVIPVAIRPSLDGLCDGAVVLNPEEEVDGCLFIGV